MNNRIVVWKMIVHAEKVTEYCAGYSYSDFEADSKLVEACVFNLSQMGELANHLDSDFIANHANVMWHAIKGLRNRIIHDYEGVNLNLVWEIIKNDLPDTVSKLEKIRF